MFHLMDFLEQFGTTVTILAGTSIILLSGFLLTRITKLLKLPNVSGYIVAGVLIGPSVLNLVSKDFVENLNFISDIALAFIAFGVGKFFKKEVLRKSGLKIVLITLLEALLSGILIFIVMFCGFHLSLTFSLILAAIATATAPASTMMTIHQYHAKGEFVDTLLQVVALDDVVCLLTFSICIAIGQSVEADSFSAMTIILPIVYNILFIILGFILGFVLAKVLTSKRSKDNRLIITTALLLGLSGACGIFDISPLLSCMIFGASYINFTNDKELFRQINNFTPPIMCLFFVKSGMSLDLVALKSVGVIGLTYFLVRIVGKLLGSYLGCFACKKDRKIRNTLGLALIPQAGVSIGLAFMGQRLLSPDMGNLLLTIILASSVLYEMVGPACAKLSLILSGSIPKKETSVGGVLSAPISQQPVKQYDKK